MEPRVHFITLGVTDLAAARAFYVDGLGWKPTFEVDGEVSFLQVGPGLLLSLWHRESLIEDSNMASTATPSNSAFTLSHNVESEDAVREVMRVAESAGAKVLKPAQRADFGGFHGHFADPSGFVWEIAHNSGWHIEPDGTVVLGPLE
jgi:catechol 2,3-dioxygenase-like lactoylglutathione lyase family enzyme